MDKHCPQHFDQDLISGYLDRELRQEDEQLVRVHLEDCAACRTLHTELGRLREAAMTTRFEQPDDQQWNEAAKSGSALATRGLGWTMAIIWAVVCAAFALWQLWIEPQSLVFRLLTFGGLTAFALLFLSVVIDRVKTLRDDPYREVKK